MRNNIKHLKYVSSDKTKNAQILKINGSNTSINTIITNAFQAPIETENINNHLNSEYKITNLDTTKNITDLNSTNNENESKNTRYERKNENENETKFETESDNIIKIKSKYRYKNKNENKNCIKKLEQKNVETNEKHEINNNIETTKNNKLVIYQNKINLKPTNNIYDNEYNIISNKQQIKHDNITSFENNVLHKEKLSTKLKIGKIITNMDTNLIDKKIITDSEGTPFSICPSLNSY